MKFCARCSEWFGDEAAFCPHDGTPLERNRDRFLGRTLAARYRLIRRLGSGGMSVVYLARHELIARQSAIKILRPELALTSEHRERFLREARSVNRINHPNIVEITDVGESDGIAYLVMEFIEGESIYAAISRAPFSWGRALRIGMQVASALARAHQMGVIHRDLKPDNILLVKRGPDDTESEHVKLTDFGIAKVAGEPSLTVNEQLFGTPGYIAPEYVGGLGIDARSDIYSLAVVVYEMISGKLPFEGKGQAELLLRPLTSAPIPLGRRVEGLPPDLESFILRCLARDPRDRPFDAFAVHDAFADILRRFAGSPSSDSHAAVTSEHESGLRATVVDRTTVLRASGTDHVDTAMATHAMSSRWSSALASLEAHIESARQRGGVHARAAARASELAVLAADMVPRLTRAAKWVGELQAKVDLLEAKGREFRTNLGHAIDVLVHDRSRERAHLDALKARRQALQRSMLEGTSPLGAGHQDSRAWEVEALIGEEERALQSDEGLAFQIHTLQARLDANNEAFERELIFATGQLEGALSALRRLTSEMVRSIDDGMGILQRAA